MSMGRAQRATLAGAPAEFERREGWGHRGSRAGEGEMGMLIKSFTASEADAGSRPQLGLSLAV